VDAREAIKVGGYGPGLHIEDNKLASIHVCDVKAPLCGIDALVIETDWRSGQWYVGNLGQG
jgi:hypothetical protein